MKPITTKWIDRYKDDDPRPVTQDAVFLEHVPERSDTETEKSYAALASANDVFEKYVFLYMNVGFMFISTCANIIIFCINTFTYTFLQQRQLDSVIVAFIQIVCYIIIIIEIVSSILHHICKKIARQRAVKPRHWIIIVTDIILQVVVTTLGLTVSWNRSYLSIFEVFRLFRVLVFYGLISSSPGKHNFFFNLLKFTMVVFLINHLSAVAIQAYELTTIGRRYTWHRSFEDTFDEPLNNSAFLYLYTYYVVLGSLGNVGAVAPSNQNNLEQIICIFLMLLGMIYIHGIFLGTFTSLRLINYQMKTIYYNKLRLINKHMLDYNMPKKIRVQIQNYYTELWNNEGAIISSSLVDELPMALQHAIYLDKYWFFFENSNVFENSHYGFKRALSYAMETRIYSCGETVYVANTVKNAMMYIHRGNIQVLSAEDMESPLLTLDVGTIISETCLVTVHSSPLQIIASTYCVAYCITKPEFWRIVTQFRKVQMGQYIHTKYKQIFDLAREKQRSEAKTLDLKRSSKSLEGMLVRAEQNSKNNQLKILYILNKHIGKSNRTDEIFIHTKFPWILNGSSRLVFYWELIIVVFTFLVAIVLPYVSVFQQNSQYYFRIVDCYMNFLYILDVVIYLFIAVEDESGLRVTVMAILTVRIHSFFILDIIAAVPFENILQLIAMDKSVRILSCLPMIRLVKFHKVVKFFTKVENSFKFDLALLRLTKYILYLSFSAYIMAAIFYINATDEKGFSPQSWAMVWLTRQPELDELDIFLNTLKSSFEVVLLSGSGILLMTTLGDLMFLMIFLSISLVMYTYIAADFTATLTLNSYELNVYSRTMQTIRQISLNPILQTAESKRNLDRIYDYLASQWYFNHGTQIKKLLSDGPDSLYEVQQIAKYSFVLEKIPIFANFGRLFCDNLSVCCEEVHFIANTYFVNENQICDYMYIINKGHCELIEGTSNRVEKLLGPEANFCVMEAMVDMNNVFFCRSVTSVALVRISKKHLQSALRNVPGMEAECRRFLHEIKTSLVYAHFRVRYQRIMVEDDQEHIASFFVFPNDKTDPLYQDFLFGWSKFGFLRYVMMPLTIMPAGKFIIAWEIIYNILTYALLVTALTYDCWSAISYRYAIIMRVLEAYQLLAIYLRFHVCYYNNKGLLISHPRLTGFHYLSGAFVVDVISILPIVDIYRMVTGASSSGLTGVYNFNKLLLLYRFPTAYYYFKRDVLKPRGITLNICFFIPIVIIFFLTWTCVIITIGAQVVVGPGRQYYIPINDSILWELTNFREYDFDTRSPIGMFLAPLYHISGLAMQLGAHPFMIKNSWEVALTVIITLSGYIMFTFVLVRIINSQTIINSALTMYQSHMKNAIKFMKNAKVTKSVQREAIRYYEYSWQQLHGLDIGDVLSRCHTVLCEDFLYDQYKNTFDNVSIFHNLDNTIYRELSREVTRVYMLPNVAFIRLNDIVSKMYIVHSGRIEVYGPDGKLFKRLHSGAMFGCLDNITCIRSMVSFVSVDSVDLLQVDAKVFYTVMAGGTISDLKAALYKSNMSYIEGRKEVKDEIVTIEDPNKNLWATKVLTSLGLDMVYLAISFASLIAVGYAATFYYGAGDYSVIIVYVFDLMHIAILCIKMFTPYYDTKGQLITNLRMIRKRYVRLPIFYLNLFAVIPLEAIFLINMNIASQMLIYRTLLLTRLVRIYNIIIFFRQYNDILNSNLLIMKLMSVIATTTLVLHFETCILATVARKGSLSYQRGIWPYQIQDQGEILICGIPYVCAFYFATSMLTCSGFPIYPRAIYGVGAAILFSVTSKFIVSVTVAKLSACIQNYGADLSRYDKIFTEMKKYLVRSSVSEYLIKSIVYYCEQLWMGSKGVQQPYLLVHSPSYLKEQIKNEAFGKHIYSSALFENTHTDFLRHITRKIDMQIFFKNDIICEQGDINETMYFIHSGNVDVIYSTDQEEIKVDELQELDSFGVIQGLYERTPQTHKFKATAVTVLCTLKLKDWKYILDFYPASRYEIYQTLYSL